jgi:emfourin
MRVQFTVEGGIAAFPGLSKPVTIDSDAMPEADASRLRQLVDAARFFDLPAASAAARRGAADYRQYTITVQDGRQRHTLRLADPVESPDLQALVDFLQSQARAQRAAARGEAGGEAGGRRPGAPDSDRSDDEQ